MTTGEFWRSVWLICTGIGLGLTLQYAYIGDERAVSVFFLAVIAFSAAVSAKEHFDGPKN